MCPSQTHYPTSCGERKWFLGQILCLVMTAGKLPKAFMIFSCQNLGERIYVPSSLRLPAHSLPPSREFMRGTEKEMRKHLEIFRNQYYTQNLIITLSFTQFVFQPPQRNLLFLNWIRMQAQLCYLFCSWSLKMLSGSPQCEKTEVLYKQKNWFGFSPGN